MKDILYKYKYKYKYEFGVLKMIAERMIVIVWKGDKMFKNYKSLYMFLFIIILIFSVKVYSQSKEKLEGYWIGDWIRDNSTLQVTMKFNYDKKQIKGTFSSDQLRALDIPLQEVHYYDLKVNWKIVGDVSTTLFSGKISGNKIEGKFEENGSGGTFHLTRSKEKYGKPVEEELIINNGEVKLSGTLLLPNNSREKFPLIIFLHGSGAEGRWASKYLATRFAQQGIAGFIYDKRGVGNSTGDWKSVGFEKLVSDAVDVINALKKNARIDSNNVGIYGHSQGGAIAPWVAVKAQSLAFIVCSSGPGLKMDEIEKYSLENSIGIDSLQSEQKKKAVKFVDAIIQTGYHLSPYSKLIEFYGTIKNEPWVFQPPAEDNYYWDFSRKISSYDPINYWKKVKSPVLFLYGESDERVPVRKSISRISEALLSERANDLTVKIFPNSDHTLRLVQKIIGRFQWPLNAKGYPDVVIEWVKQIVNHNSPIMN